MAALPGDEVSEGDPILSVEAMKMEAKVGAPVTGTLVEVYVSPETRSQPARSSRR